MSRWVRCLWVLAMLAPMRASALPDLVVESVVLEPTQPALGHVVEVVANIANFGEDSVGDFLCIGGDVVVLFLLDGEVFAEEQLSCGLDVDEVDSESASVVIATAGDHVIEVRIDPDNEIEESDESNNSAFVDVSPAAPEVEVTNSLPSVGAPGLVDVAVTISVTNNTPAKIKDVFVYLELVGKSGQVDFGGKQGADLSPGETDTWESKVNYGLDVQYGAFPPGEYTWRYQVFHGGLPPSADALPLTEEMTAPIELMDTVIVNQDNVVIPTVDPVVSGVGPVTSFTARDVVVDGVTYDVSLGFVEPIDVYTASSWAIFSRVHALEVTEEGVTVCDADVRRKAAQAVLLWRDLVVEHPWYRGSYVALQEAYDWYKDEKNLKVVFYITQPFVIVKELLEDMLAIGSEYADWVKLKTGLTTPEEQEVATMTFEVTTIVTKAFDTAGSATQGLVKLSPLLAGEAYLSGHVISERLLEAIDAGGEDFDEAIDLVHELIQEHSPERYQKITQAVPISVVLGAIGSTLLDGVRSVLWTSIKRGFTAYFMSKLTAKTAWKIAVGEGSAALMAGLTTAGIAKGIASFGLTLIIDASIAYLTYVGTFVDNIRGPGGLIEAGQTIAQTVPWEHTQYLADGTGSPLDADGVDDTFLAHAVMYEVYGFILSDLAMLKKLAFAKQQSQGFLDDSLAMFEVSKAQRQFALGLQSASVLLAAGPCEAGAPPQQGSIDPLVAHEPPPGDPAEEVEVPAEPEKRRWVKPRAQPEPDERGSHPAVPWVEHGETLGPPDVPVPPTVQVVGDGCTAGSPGGERAPMGGVLVLLIAGLLAWARREEVRA